ncbi:hypothetical protein OPQ81_008511 [Rhizoctonia solani]|nr:hypothetical protein OPQ81_008511 [Rhizoctonia solani]
MPLHNVTIDDASALIGYYNPNGIPWKDSPANDSALDEYWDHTYHSSNQSGAWSTFRFQGTAVYLFAATRIMHGKYNILIDDQQAYQGDGYTQTSIFKQLVFNATSLSPGWHNLTFVNAEPGRYIEVDYIKWTTVMSAARTENSGTPIPPTLGNMTYDASVWDENAPGSTPYITQVDNLDPHEFNAYSGKLHNTLLFRQDNLTDGDHTLIVTNRGNALAIASALPIMWSTGQDPQGGLRYLDGRLIAGVVIGLTLGMTLLVVLWLWLARRHHAYQGVYTDGHFNVPKIYQPTFEATPFILPLSPVGEQTTSHSGGSYDDEVAQDTSYPARYHALPASPGLGSWSRFEYDSSVTAPSPGFNRLLSSSGLYPHGVSPVIPGNTSPPGNSHRPMAPASPTHAQSPDMLISLRDSDAGPVLLPPSYSTAIISRKRN